MGAGFRPCVVCRGNPVGLVYVMPALDPDNPIIKLYIAAHYLARFA